jgi:molybdate transport system substrate-binding protein
MRRVVCFVLFCAGLTWPAELQVAAAADLAQVESALGTAFAKGSGVKVQWITGSSGLLAKQAENGAPFDVFLSASEGYVNDLVTHDAAVRDTVVIYATGRIGMWTPPSSRGVSPARELTDLLKPEVKRISIANPAHAPYGMAAKEALESAGLWEKLSAKLVYGENVRQALEFGESGNADVVLTAWALVKSKSGAIQVAPAGRYKPLRQAGVVLKSTHEPGAARDFLRFLMTPAAQTILRDAGFESAVE